ncbi:protein FAM221B isoform X2 [Hemicordylus capensis]|uniref:protein FAM221B isoform X2 n=1 Tax=Hemicordylus capensis TaxID=884348 RepID=UPI002303C89E|nr:protein FAM221B isoform X2 [Hemicordylus capensis]
MEEEEEEPMEEVPEEGASEPPVSEEEQEQGGEEEEDAALLRTSSTALEVEEELIVPTSTTAEDDDDDEDTLEPRSTTSREEGERGGLRDTSLLLPPPPSSSEDESSESGAPREQRSPPSGASSPPPPPPREDLSSAPSSLTTSPLPWKVPPEEGDVSAEAERGLPAAESSGSSPPRDQQLELKKAKKKVAAKKGALNYTVRPVVPAEKAELLSVAKAMHRENFGKNVKELFHLEKEAALRSIETGALLPGTERLLWTGCGEASPNSIQRRRKCSGLGKRIIRVVRAAGNRALHPPRLPLPGLHLHPIPPGGSGRILAAEEDRVRSGWLEGQVPLQAHSRGARPGRSPLLWGPRAPQDSGEGRQEGLRVACSRDSSSCRWKAIKRACSQHGGSGLWVCVWRGAGGGRSGPLASIPGCRPCSQQSVFPGGGLREPSREPSMAQAGSPLLAWLRTLPPSFRASRQPCWIRPKEARLVQHPVSHTNPPDASEKPTGKRGGCRGTVA